MTSIPDAVEQASARLRADLQGASDRIQAEQAQLVNVWPTLTVAARRRALRRLQSTVVALAVDAGEIARAQVSGVLSTAYGLGAGQVAASVGRAPAYSGVDTAAMTALAQDTYADVLAATRHVQESVKELVRVLARERITDKLLVGQPPAEAARKLARDLEGRGISAVVYKDGSAHQLGDYADMLVRTKSAEAAQLGGFQQARATGIEFMELMDGPGCGLSSHKDARKANGLILSVDEAARYPLSHPRCRRVASPRPDITSAEHARTAEPIGPQFTAEQIARAHVDSPAAARARARVARRTSTGTLVLERGESKAARSNAARVKKRTRPGSGRP